MDYRELNKVTLPLHAAVPTIAALMDTLCHELGTYHYVVDLANAFFSIDIAQESYGQFAFMWEGQQQTFTVLPQGYLHSHTICHTLAAQVLATLSSLLLWLPPSMAALFRQARGLGCSCSAVLNQHPT